MLAVTVDRLSETLVTRAFARAGIEMGGNRSWDVTVRGREFFARVAKNPAFELGETYMDGLWDCDAIDELFFRLIVSGVAGAHEQRRTFRLRSAWARVRNRQSRSRAGAVADAHYDLDAELYRQMLDSSLTYTCAYWSSPEDSLESAQVKKLAMICEKLALTPGETLLDIGCGFGGLAAFAARNHGVRVVGITNSAQHCAIATERTRGLPVEIRLLDYRELPSLRRRFDKIASIEMIEAVGPRNFGTYMNVAYDCLEPGGLFLLQSFISDSARYVCNEWFDRYIFPNGVSPALSQLLDATDGNFGTPRHIEDMSAHYSPTLLAWDRNLSRAWNKLRPYDQRFRRMWHFYLTCLAGFFRAEDLHLQQILFGRGHVGEPFGA